MHLSHHGLKRTFFLLLIRGANATLPESDRPTDRYLPAYPPRTMSRSWNADFIRDSGKLARNDVNEYLPACQENKRPFKMTISP